MVAPKFRCDYLSQLALSSGWQVAELPPPVRAKSILRFDNAGGSAIIRRPLRLAMHRMNFKRHHYMAREETGHLRRRWLRALGRTHRRNAWGGTAHTPNA